LNNNLSPTEKKHQIERGTFHHNGSQEKTIILRTGDLPTAMAVGLQWRVSEEEEEGEGTCTIESKKLQR